MNPKIYLQIRRISYGGMEEGCRFSSAMHPFIALRAMNGQLSPYKIAMPSQLESAYATSRCGLAPNNSAIINALTSKLAGRYYFTIARLVD